MLIAHAVSAYFAVKLTQTQWDEDWSQAQRWLLASIAVGSTILPDADVVYNIVVRGFANHSLLGTHSIWLYSIFMLSAIICKLAKWHYLAWCLGFIALGGYSHILLDAIVHNTPLFYPLSMQMVGTAPQSIVEGGTPVYIRHPLFLLEIALWGAVLLHWFHKKCKDSGQVFTKS